MRPPSQATGGTHPLTVSACLTQSHHATNSHLYMHTSRHKQPQWLTWWSVRGSPTIKRRGSLKAFWIWLVKVPGVNLPATAVAPIWLANLRMARCRVHNEQGHSQHCHTTPTSHTQPYKHQGCISGGRGTQMAFWLTCPPPHLWSLSFVLSLFNNLLNTSPNTFWGVASTGVCCLTYLSHGPAGYDTDVSRVFNGYNDPGSH